MVKVVKEKPAPKRGGLLYWSLLFLFRGLIPTIALIIIPLFAAIASGTIKFYLIPIAGLIATYFWVRRKHKKIMAMSSEEYKRTHKIKITKGSDGNVSRVPDAYDAIMSGEINIPGTAGYIYNTSRD